MVRKKQRSKEKVTALGLLLSATLIAAAGGAIALVDTSSGSPAGEASSAEVGEARDDATSAVGASETAESDAEARDATAPEAKTRTPQRAKTPKAGNRRL